MPIAVVVLLFLRLLLLPHFCLRLLLLRLYGRLLGFGLHRIFTLRNC